MLESPAEVRGSSLSRAGLAVQPAKVELELRRGEERQRSLRTALCAMHAGKGVRTRGDVLVVTPLRGVVLARVCPDWAGSGPLRTPFELRRRVAATAWPPPPLWVGASDLHKESGRALT